MGLIQSLVAKYKQRQEELAVRLKEQQDQRAIVRQKEDERKEFAQKLIEYASDGKLTLEELNYIEGQGTKLEIPESEMDQIKVRVYQLAYDAIKRDGKITAEEEAELHELQSYFKISEDAIAPSKKELARFRLLREISNGNMPSIQVSNMVLQRGEIPFWTESGKILEERVVNRRYEGGSRGVSVRIMKGVSYRVGAHKGRLIADTAVVPVSSGDFVVTNKRMVFKGDRKSFSLKHEKILNVEFYSDGINLAEESGKHRVVQFDGTQNMDIVGSVVAHAINNRA